MDSDPTAEQIAGTAPRNRGNSGMFQLAGDLRGDRVTAEYFNWNGTRAGALNSPDPPRSNAVADFVRDYVQNHPRDRIALVGNSWGGHTALEVAQQLFAHEAPVAVNLVVFLDASSAGRGIAKPQALPLNVNRAAHYFTRNVFAWGRLDAEKRLENIDLGDPASGFMRDGRPAYNARFDFQAHVAAEWDERIHADIRRRLLALLPDDAPAHAASAVRQRH
jgi:pimeloyl-ACP methyl ester carboxylesterase